MAAVREMEGGREGGKKPSVRPRKQQRAKQRTLPELSGRGDAMLAVAVEWSNFQ
jgi:hypothetical protein